MGNIIREPAVAGLFYEKYSPMLTTQLRELFDMVPPEIGPNECTRALIVPHAGYVFSGKVAASAYTALPPDGQWERIFVLGSSHRIAFEGASVFNQAGFKTPLGTVEVDTEMADKLANSSPVYSSDTYTHQHEHSLEVQLPFLQYHLSKPFRIVPILLGNCNNQSFGMLADSLAPYFTKENLFVVSTDFSHYPPYHEALKADMATADAIATNNPETLKAQLNANATKGYHELHTSLCGWTSVMTLLHITSRLKDLQFKKILYQNSGDAWMGDKARVVGYWAIAVEQKNITCDDFDFSDEEKKTLLRISRTALKACVTGKTPPKPSAASLSEKLKENYGAFVSLYVNGTLRGCIGQLKAHKPLWQTVTEMTCAAAQNDYRFPQVTPDETDSISIEISVLSPLKPIDDYSEIELGRHGVHLQKGSHSGTFLPQVAKRNNWTLEEFLGHLSRDKAGLAWDDWHNAELSVYEAVVFGDK